jgi:alkylated DNA repair dioxygenase AlkB
MYINCIKETDNTHSIFIMIDHFLTTEEIARHHELLNDVNDWKGGTFFGNGMPRLQKWFQDDNKYFSKNWHTQTHERWMSQNADEWLMNLRQKVQTKVDEIFDNEIDKKFNGCNRPTLNSSLINFYRDGKDTIRYHRDDEKVFGDNPTITMLTFGAERELKFKRPDNHDLDTSFVIKSGSLFMMMGSVQKKYFHGIERNLDVKEGRYSVTFREHKN